MRISGRQPDELRKVIIRRGFIKYPEGSVLIEMGDTKVLCNASIEESVPGWMRGSGRGWLTAEYAMLPRSTHERSARDSTKGKIGGRNMEIQRLIGRSLRAVIDLDLLGERTIRFDCDVLQADGGTRTAAITGAYVALCDALATLRAEGLLDKDPLRDRLAAISVGKVDDELCLDLEYSEDVRAEVDMNIVMTGSGKLIEVQGTAEGDPFSREELDAMLNLAEKGINELFELQEASLAAPPEVE